MDLCSILANIYCNITWLSKQFALRATKINQKNLWVAQRYLAMITWSSRQRCIFMVWVPPLCAFMHVI